MSRTSTEGWRAIVEQPFRADEAAGVARRLGDALGSLEGARRHDESAALLEHLLGTRRAYGLTLFVLSELDDAELLDVLATSLAPLPGRLFEADEAYLAELVRLVASAPETAAHEVVATYLLERAIGPHWTTVVWALWPRRKPLFARAWSRFFDRTDPTTWDDPAVLEPFLATPDAVALVRERVHADHRSASWVTIRDAVERRAHRSGWLTDDQRAALERSLG